ncbi:hypothetical protein Tco_1034650, partial [Tanacetum coccineum]
SDNSRKGIGYNAVAPPPTGLFAPPIIDLSNSGLKEFQQPEFEGYGVKANKSVCVDASKEIKKTSDVPIIEDWVSDCDEDESVVKVYTAKINSVNTAKGKRVTSAIGKQWINAVKSTSCWVWRPKIKVQGHVSKNSGSYICKQFDYVDPAGRHKVLVGKDPHTELRGYGAKALTKLRKEGQELGRQAHGEDEVDIYDNLLEGESAEVAAVRFIKIRGARLRTSSRFSLFGEHEVAQNDVLLLREVAFDLLRDALSAIFGLSELKEINEEEDLVSEDPSKKGRMEETEYDNVEEEYAEVDFEDQFSVLCTAKILAEASSERVKTYNRRIRSTDSPRVSTATDLFSTAEETNEELARKVQEEEQAKAMEQQEQE